MYRYFEREDNNSFLMEDPTYCDILRKLDGFVVTLGKEDKSRFIKLISECYYNLHKSIQAKSHTDVELLNSLIVALLIGQIKEIERYQLN